jgi:hypothetical protein
MSDSRDTFASPAARDLLAGLDMHVSGDSLSLTLDGMEAEATTEANSLNDAEANNLSFIVSDRVSRMDSCLTTLEGEANEINYVQLAEKVAQRLEELAARVSQPTEET